MLTAEVVPGALVRFAPQPLALSERVCTNHRSPAAVWYCRAFPRRKGKRVSSVMEGGQEVLKRESMGRRFKGELRDLVERIHSTEVRNEDAGAASFHCACLP